MFCETLHYIEEVAWITGFICKEKYSNSYHLPRKSGYDYWQTANNDLKAFYESSQPQQIFSETILRLPFGLNLNFNGMKAWTRTELGNPASIQTPYLHFLHFLVYRTEQFCFWLIKWRFSLQLTKRVNFFTYKLDFNLLSQTVLLMSEKEKYI